MATREDTHELLDSVRYAIENNRSDRGGVFLGDALEAAIKDAALAAPAPNADGLLPCAHCGGRTATVQPEGMAYRCRCSSCGASGPLGTTQRLAREAWNRRHTPAADGGLHPAARIPPTRAPCDHTYECTNCEPDHGDLAPAPVEQAPPICNSVRGAAPSYSCEGYSGHAGPHHAIDREVEWSTPAAPEPEAPAEDVWRAAIAALADVENKARKLDAIHAILVANEIDSDVVAGVQGLIDAYGRLAHDVREEAAHCGHTAGIMDDFTEQDRAAADRYRAQQEPK